MVKVMGLEVTPPPYTPPVVTTVTDAIPGLAMSAAEIAAVSPIVEL